MTIDTACSSSLSALHTAFQSLQTGESSVAIVGGSHLNLRPETSGSSYAFDERATSGFGRGEGTVCVVLKLLDAALKAGDPIRAIIRNSGVNQDGKTAGVTMPNGSAQAALMRSVYASAGLNPLETGYVEAHGTGTATGDPIEATALGEVFQRGPHQEPLILGSLKSNIGYLEGASGVASVLKCALMLERRFIPPNYDFQNPNSKIPFKKWNMKHVIMEETAPTNPHASVNGHSLSNGHAHQNGLDFEVDTPLQQRVYVFSANDRGSLEKQLSKITVYVKERPTFLYPALLDSLAFTLGQRRSILPWKAAFSAPTPDALFQNLADQAVIPTKSGGQPKIGFVFTGQGSQWATMGMELFYTYPVYALAIRKADNALLDLGASWSLILEMEKPKETSNIDRPYISQPACTALQIALVDLLRSWGITPHSIFGHSSGEIAAAYSAGILDFESCMALAYWRGVVSTTLSEDFKYVRGGMIAVGASQEMTQALIDDCARAKVVIACINSPFSMTVSGDEAAISEIQHLADKRQVWNRRLKIDVTYHSHHMVHVADKYRSLLGDVHPNSKAWHNSEFFSSLRGGLIDPSSLDTSYWVENLTSRVRFAEALQSLCEPGMGVDQKTSISSLRLGLTQHCRVQFDRCCKYQGIPHKRLITMPLLCAMKTASQLCSVWQLVCSCKDAVRTWEL
ncbi:Type I Iterative PKS [Lepraria neglecta]|uniref:Type I Iterative PKS n=1 Tax=Lepraria neglecta TaxID=209136 RepID=A0AAD9Z5L5_9LECA|nr:Type I Iterative PKS [Lepraria neglecta]